MSDKKKLVITITANAKNDVSTVAFTVANGALSKDMEVGIFLSSDGVAGETWQVHGAGWPFIALYSVFGNDPNAPLPADLVQMLG